MEKYGEGAMGRRDGGKRGEGAKRMEVGLEEG